MYRKLTLLIFVTVLVFVPHSRSFAQIRPLVIAWQAPVGRDAIYGNNPTTCNHTSIGCLSCPPLATEYSCFLSNVLPNISGVGFVIPWGLVDTCAANGKTSNSPCLADSGCSVSGGTCYYWDWIDKALMDFVNASVGPTGSGKTWTNGCAGGNPCKIVLIVWLTQDSSGPNLFDGTPNTPAYVFTQAYANDVGTGCGTTCAPQDVLVCQAWQGGTGPGWTGQPYIGDTAWAMGGGQGDYGIWNAQGAMILASGGSMFYNPPPANNYSGYPVMYEKPILTAAEKFITALALHYSSACIYSSCGSGPTIAQSIAYMRIGPSSGGENYPYCSSSTPTVYAGSCPVSGAYWPGPQGYTSSEKQCFSDQGYLTSWPMNNDGLGYISSLYSYINQQNWAFPIDTPSHEGPPSNSSTMYADTEAFLANQYALGTGMQAASIGDLLTYATQYSPSSTANWAVHFRQFPSV